MAHGAPRVRRVEAAARAAGARRALNFPEGVQAQVDAIRAAAEERGVIAALAADATAPTGSDTEAMAFVAARNAAEAERLGRGCAQGKREPGRAQGRLDEAFAAEGSPEWVVEASEQRMARWWPALQAQARRLAKVSAMSAGARESTGEGGLGFLRCALNAWVVGHRLHMEEVPCCLMGCGEGSADTLAHCVQCPRI